MRTGLENRGNGPQQEGMRWQVAAAVICLALAVLMVINNQMGGETMWFWYATVFHNGAKLYSQLHTALQPLFVLETSAWMRLFGTKLIAYEIPSLIHAVLLAVGIYLVLQESDWPDWQKAFVLLGIFVYIVCGHSYRFDDYHIIAEALMVYALWLLLCIGRPGPLVEERSDYQNVLWLGLVCGLDAATRITDGMALLVASAISLAFLLHGLRRKAIGLTLLFVSTVSVLLLIVKLTGDSISAWSSSSIFRAASSKGGTGSIFSAPFVVVGNTLSLVVTQKRIPLLLALLVLFGYAIARYRPRSVRFIVPAQFAAAGLMFLFTSPINRMDLKSGLLFEDLVLYLTLLMYPFAAWVLVRYLRQRQGRGTWDPREVLIVIPILEWASVSAAAAGYPLTNYYVSVALLVLLIPVVQPFRRYAVWANPSLVTILGLLALNGIVAKVMIPYSWQNYRFEPMFTNRAVYHHPVYGTMYVDRDLLQFSKQLCDEIGAQPGRTQPELLSLPYPYPNYFCATPPWHNYVQTFFDTATRSTIEQLIRELAADPPKWILYQRQLNIMIGAERLYNHGQPIGQRDLDLFIADKLREGEWTMVEHSDYLRPKDTDAALGTGWYLIRTKP